MTDVSGAKIRSGYSDVEVDLNIALCVIKSRLLNGLAKNCSNLTCDTEDRLAVRSVCRDGNVENIIVKAKDRLYVCTRNGVSRKNQKSVVACAGEHILGNTDLNT